MPASIWTAAAVAACVVASLFLLPAHGTIDVDRFWLPWIERITADGLRVAYRDSASDYPPLAFVILAGMGALSATLDLSVHAGLKLVLWTFLAAAGAAAFWTTRRRELTIGLYAALLIGSLGLAYLDVVFVPTLVLSLGAFQHGHPALGLLMYSLSCLIKFQPLIIGPVLGLYLMQSRQLHLRVLAPSMVLATVVLVAFGSAVVDGLFRASSHRDLSGQALNFYWIASAAISTLILNRSIFDSPFVAASPGVLLALRLVFGALYVWLLTRLSMRTFPEFLRAASLVYLAYFAFSPGVHENHLVVLVVLVAVLAGFTAHTREFVAVAVFANVNLVLFYGIDGRASWGGIVAPVSLILAICLTVTAAWTLIVASRPLVARGA